jgi:CheY-like chemotaxis protein
MALRDTAQRILLIDADDLRRQSRVQMLESVGYEVETRTNYMAAEQLDHESEFDLIECRAAFVPESMRQTGMRGAIYGARKEA